MELTPPLPHHTLDQLSHTGLSFSASDCPYMGEKWVRIKSDYDAGEKDQQSSVQSIKENRAEGAAHFPGGLEGGDGVSGRSFQGK